MADTDVAMKLAPVLLVETIEPGLHFWVEGLGFTLTTTVPDIGPYVFAIVARDGVEVMFQTIASAEQDLGPGVMNGKTILYLSLAAIDPVLARLGQVDVAVERRQTFYGADEIYLREPGGHIVGLAAHPV